jgi:hypothetical protein
MNISSFFEKLGAPLRVNRQSWGAVREKDGAVFLRVWQDRKMVKDKTPVMMVTHREKYVNDQNNFGFKERLEHVELIRNGAKCFIVMCKVKDREAMPRTIETFNDKEIFVGGDILEIDGETWVKVHSRVPVEEVLLK